MLLRGRVGFWVLPPVVLVCWGEAPAGVLCIRLLTAVTSSSPAARSQRGFPRTKTWRLLALCARGPGLSPCDAEPCVRGWSVWELLGTAGAVGQSCGCGLHGICRGAVPTAVASGVRCSCVRCRAAMCQHGVPQIEELFIAGQAAWGWASRLCGAASCTGSSVLSGAPSGTRTWGVRAWQAADPP